MNNQGKKLVKAGIALSLLTSTLLHATNGDHLIGIGAKTRGMAGTGIALSQGAESALQNPALITSVKGTQISFGGTVFMPDVKFMGMQSDADMNVIPSVSLAHNLGNNWYIGTGMWGTAGMGVDYPLMGVSTTLQLMQFAVPVAYKGENYSFGIAPIMQYGSLDINAGALQTGQHQDFGFGFNLGMTYDITENFTFGAMYKSAISMTYDYTLSNFMSPTGDKLQQPAEYGVGLAYTTGEHTIALDAKKK
jgi:long-chain fatty acid transport protein